MEMGSSFFLMVGGQIKSVKLPEIEEIYCKYCFVHGADWVVISGIEEGISQMSRVGLDETQPFIFNFPLDITFKATNPYGWPQLVMCIYGIDAFGNDIVHGYGSVYIPTVFGRSQRAVPLFVPDSSSSLQKFTSWLLGCRPEYVDQRVISQGEGREVSRVCSRGFAEVSFNIALKNAQQMGYDIC